MKTEKLTDLGFTKWHPLAEISASDFGGAGEVVFVLRYKGTGKRALPEVRYVGRSKRPMRKILGGLVGGYGGKTTTGLNKKLMTRNTISRINISWKASKDSKVEQKKILEEFRALNGDVPLWNRGKVKPKAAPKTKDPKQVKPAKPAKKVKPAKPAKSDKPAKTQAKSTTKPVKTGKTAKSSGQPTAPRRRGRPRKTPA
jgi:hypothetical protein